MGNLAEGFHRNIDRITMRVLQCAANTEIEHVKEGIATAQERIGQAISVGQLLQKDSRILGKLAEANKKLGEFGEAIGLIQDICKDIEALVKIRSAIRILKDDHIIEKDPETAARAFGVLFVGFGRLCRFLEPLKPWSQFFENAGDFFVNLRAGIVPELQPHTVNLKKQMKKSVDTLPVFDN